MERGTKDKVAELLIIMKNGDEIMLFRSWEDIVITEKGIELIPNATGWEYNWNNVEKIKIINTISPNHYSNKKYDIGDIGIQTLEVRSGGS